MQRHFHLFVYGTLRQRGRAAELLRGCTHLGPARVAGSLYDIEGGFPALVLAGGGLVHGEVWRCAFELLAMLDDYEHTSTGLFRRAAVRAGDHACWAYVAGPALAHRLTTERLIPSGRWRD